MFSTSVTWTKFIFLSLSLFCFLLIKFIYSWLFLRFLLIKFYLDSVSFFMMHSMSGSFPECFGLSADNHICVPISPVSYSLLQCLLCCHCFVSWWTESLWLIFLCAHMASTSNVHSSNIYCKYEWMSECLKKL